MGEGDSISKGFYIFIMVGTLAAGAVNNIMVKNQDLTVDKDNGKQFFHPFVQTMIMFISEFACLIAFVIAYKFGTGFRAKHDEEEEEADRNGLRTKKVWWIPAIPATCDIASTCLQMIALAFISQSIYIMLRGGAPIITAALSIIFLKKKLLRAQYLGLFLAVVGITIVGVNGYLTSDKEANGNLAVGLICVFCSLITTGIQFVIEEKILQTNHFHPLKMVGLEGAFGILYTIIALAISCNIPCDRNSDSCNYNGKFEDVGNALKNIFTNGLLILWVILGMISLGFFNFFGMSVTKHVSSLARAILLISTTVIIWVYDLIFVGEKFYWAQLGGFVVLVVGNLIYQKIIPLKFLDPHADEKNAHLLKGSRASSSKASFGKVSIHEPVVHDVIVREGDYGDHHQHHHHHKDDHEYYS